MIIFDNKSQRLIFSGSLKFFNILLCLNMEYQKPKTYYQSKTNDFVLAHGDCFKLLKEFDFKFDMIFADPPYFLSNGGISLQSGKVVCVDKGDWILDPFSGSSTTGIAANLCGRRFAGLEQEEKFCRLSMARREEIENLTSYDRLVKHIDDLQALQDCNVVNVNDSECIQMPF